MTEKNQTTKLFSNKYRFSIILILHKKGCFNAVIKKFLQLHIYKCQLFPIHSHNHITRQI